MKTTSKSLFKRIIPLLCVFQLFCPEAFAEEVDYTSYFSNASCSSLTGWTQLSDSNGGTLQLDTWSSRGGKDGSNMTTPFLEYHTDSSILPDAQLKHSTINGLIPGTYRLSILMRCYMEKDNSVDDLTGAYVNITADGTTHTVEMTDENATQGRYNGQLYEVRTVTMDFHVGSNCQFDFNIEVRDANFNWVSWKDITLTLLEADEITDIDLDGLTRAEKINLMLTGVLKDATFLITNPNMDEDSGWSSGTYGGNSENRCLEVWNNNFDSFQTLNKIPNGRYKLTVQGFYRYNYNSSNNNKDPYRYQVSYGMSHDEYEDFLNAKLYANEVESPLMSIADEYEATKQLLGNNDNGDSRSMPFSMSDASYCFSNGLYMGNEYGDNQLEVEVTNHTLTIGVKKTTQYGCDWTLWDNFHLTLLSLGDNEGYNPDASQSMDFSEASWENPLDITSLISNPNFDEGNTGWSGSYSLGGRSANRNAEKSYGNFDVYQTIEGLPSGHYRLSAQGFYRYGDIKYQQEYSYNYGNQECVNNTVYAMYTIPMAIISRQQGFERMYAKLYANEFETPFPNLMDEVHEDYLYESDYETELGYVVNSSRGASEAFAEGKYPMSLTFTVTDGTLKFGVRKKAGYKNDWAVWDNFKLEYLGKEQMVYATEVQAPDELNLSVGQEVQLEASVLPLNASNMNVTWTSSNSNIVNITEAGYAKVKNAGNVTLYATANGGEKGSVRKAIQVSVTNSSPSSSNIVINEIMVANIDQYLDPSKNYGGWVEIYNPTNTGVSFNGMKVSLDDGQTFYNVSSGGAPAKGYGLIWFDHHSALSSQIDDKLDMDGGTIRLYNSGYEQITQEDYPAAVSRTSYARLEDGGSAWGVTAYPTPGKANTGSREVLADTSNRLPEPEVSEESKLFTSPFTVKVSIPEGATLHFTTDGTTPNLGSENISADGTFDIAQTTILRLRLSAPGALPSPVRTCSYIYKDKDYMLPILSVVGDPNVFYNDTIGVFVPGISSTHSGDNGVNYGCNWGMDWERPVAFNYMTASGDTVYSQEVDLERCGGWSRSWFPYSYKLKASSQYENLNYIAYPFFNTNKPHLKSKTLQVRNGGNDLLCRNKDLSLSYLATSCGWYLDCQDFMSVHNFVNGKYQGMLNIREPNNKHFAYTNYGIDTDEVDAMEITGGVSVKEGTADQFWHWRDLSYNCSDESVYEEICSLVDIDEFANYMAAQVYLGGDDWPGNNCKGFRSQDDGKFHIVFFDVDQALRYDAYAFTHVNNSGVPLMTIFKNMIRYNETFRRHFIDAFTIAAGSVYEPERVGEVVFRLAEEMEPALALEGLEPWTTANNTIRVLGSETRQRTMMEGLKKLSGINLTTTMQSLRMESNVSEARLMINDQIVPTNYFNGYVYPPCTVSAVAPMGYTFVGWKDQAGHLLSADADLCLDELGDREIVAEFQQMPDNELINHLAMPVKINEVGAANAVFVNEYFKKNDWIELYNTTDAVIDVAGLYLSDDIEQPMKFQIPGTTGLDTHIPAHGHLIVWADNLEASSQLHAKFKLSNSDGSMVLLSSSKQFVENNAQFFANHPALKSFADGMTYTKQSGEQSVGRYPDGGNYFYLMNHPTIERPNIRLLSDVLVGEDTGITVDFPGFILDMAAGWNWVSHPLANPISVTDFSDDMQQILSQTQSVYNDPKMGLTGSLRQLSAGQMYKFNMKSPSQYTFKDEECDASTPIALQKGWNWLGYTVNSTQTLAQALAGYEPAQSEMIVGQNGVSTYNATSRQWVGTLTSLEPGMGYMIKVNEDKQLTFSPTDEVKIKYNLSPRRLTLNKVPARYQYPNVMSIIARLDIDDASLLGDAYELQAFSDDELRGVGQMVDNLLFLTIYGNSGEPIDFTLLTADGQKVTIPETSAFLSDVLGTLDEPFVMTVSTSGTTSITDIAREESNTIRSIHYYSLTGQQVDTPVAGGFYIQKTTYEDGTIVSRKIKK